MESILEHLTFERDRLQVAKNEAMEELNAAKDEDAQSYWFVQHMITGVSLAAVINCEETIKRIGAV